MTTPVYDLAIIGGGIVGLGAALHIQRSFQVRLIVLEAEKELGQHQTGNNSGVIHSGLYYKPGSAKARNCAAGREAMYRFCADHGIAHDRCGKIVVALTPDQIPALEELERRGRANGLKGLRRLSAGELKEHEPHVAGIAGLHVPETGIVCYKDVLAKYAELLRADGGVIQLAAPLRRVRRLAGQLILETPTGAVACRALINCAGLQCDRVARLCGVDPGVQIIPFRGEYYELIPDRQHLVKNLIYPVPDPRFPFLGVHFTRMIHGGVEAGPNAVLAWKREGYTRWSISLRDMWEYLRYRGFWIMARKFWRTGLGELHRSFSKKAFHLALQRLLPDLRKDDLVPAGAGVRAQAVDPTGALVDDFRIVPAPGMIHVLNAPSPAATASLAIGRSLAELAGAQFQLSPQLRVVSRFA